MTEATPAPVWIMYAQRVKAGTTPFTHVFPGPAGVRMCGARDEDIVRVAVREVREDETSPFWGFLSTDAEQPSMIWPSFRQLNLCFPSGVLYAEKRGRGRRVNLVIEEAPDAAATLEMQISRARPGGPSHG